MDYRETKEGSEVNIPRLDPDKPEYPTDEQMTTMFTAWKKDGKAGILKVLNKMQRDEEPGQQHSQKSARVADSE